MKVWEGLNRLELVEKLVRGGSYKSEVSFTPPMVEEAEPTPPIIVKAPIARASRLAREAKPTASFDDLLNAIKGWKL